MRRAHRSGSNPPSGSDWVRYRSMSALGQKRTFSEVWVMSALPPKADIRPRDQDICFWPKSTLMQCGKPRPIDHLVGARDDGGAGVGLRAGATDGCAGGSGIFAITSATAASTALSHAPSGLDRRRVARRFAAALRDLCHLLHLPRVERGGGRRSLRNGWRLLFRTGWWFRPANPLNRSRDHLLGLWRPAKFRGPRRDYLLC